MKFTAFIQKEENMYVALCPELDIASQGETVKKAKVNLQEAVELFLDDANPEEVNFRMYEEEYISSIEVQCLGKMANGMLYYPY